MASRSSYRIRRRAKRAYEPATKGKEEAKEQSFFGPTKADPFFPAAVYRAPQGEEEEVQTKVSLQEEEEEEAQLKLDVARQEEEEEEAQTKLDVARQEEEEEQAQPKLEIARQEQEEEQAQPKLEIDPQEEEEEQAQPKLEIARQEEKEEEEEQAQPKLEITRQEQEEEEAQPKLEIARQEQEEEAVQPKEDNSGSARSPLAGAKTAAYVRDIGGRGQPISSNDQAWFGTRMGYDFSAVRIHTGGDAEASAQASRAKAYTYGRHVVFGPGQHRTDTHAGRELLAHELTHVVQQGAARPRRVGAVRRKVGPKVQRGLLDDVWDSVTGALGAVGSGIEAAATWHWDVLKSVGAWVWNLVTWNPSRVWSLLTHVGSGILGTIRWLRNGLIAGLGHYWNLARAVLPWLGDGALGLFGWIWRGLAGGGTWALRLLNGDWSGFWDGIAGAFSWLGDGARGLLDWSWRGLEGLIYWTARGARGFAAWIWEGVLANVVWVGRFLAKVFDLIGLGEMWTVLSNLLKFWSTRSLTGPEEAEARKVFGGSLPYWQVRIDEASLIAVLGAWFKNKTSMGVATAQTINFNRTLSAAAGNSDMGWLIHELGHVSQYVHLGLQYMGEALHAQATDGYEYGGGAALAGKELKDFNREQQAQILRHYYLYVEYGSSPYAADYKRLRDQAIQGRF